MKMIVRGAHAAPLGVRLGVIMNGLSCMILLLLVISFPTHVTAQNPVQLSGHTAFETFHTLEIEQLWNSTSPETAQGINVAVVVRRFDVEARPRLDKWIGCGWLLIGTGDLGSQPVGLKIWADATCHSLTIKTLRSNGKETERFELKIGGNESFELSVSPDLRVFIDEREVGTIK